MLFGSSSLEVLIGVILLFLVLAVIASAVAEIVTQLFALRSRTLHDAISTMLFSEDARQKVYDHPLIKSLSQQGRVDDFFGRIPRPSYIPSDVFARSLLDIVTVTRTGKGALEISADGLEIPDDLRKLLATLAEPLGPAVNEAGKLAAEVEKWFDDAMDRVSGWYKRHAQAWCFALAIVVTLVVNADTVKITHMLWTNTTLRALAVEAAAARRDMDPPPDLLPMVVYTDGDQPEKGTPVEFSLTPREQDLLASLTGWTSDWSDYARRAAELRASRAARAGTSGAPRAIELAFGDHLRLFVGWLGAALWRHGLGWLMTAIAVSIGAPFWFDTLKRFMNVRYAGPKPKRADA